MRIAKVSLLVVILALGWFAGYPSIAQTVEQFYKGKSLRILVGNSAGGDYDTMARLVAQHVARHIPGSPSIIVQNMPGANGITAINHLYNVAPKDGTVMATLNRQIPKLNVLGRDALQADARQLGWLGGFGEAQQVCFASSRSSIKTAKDIFEKELTVGSTSQTSGPSVTPSILNKLLGTKFRVVQGYQSTPDVILATTRGEVDGFCHSWALIKNQFGEMLRDGSIRPLIHMEDSDFDDVPNLPSVYDLAREDQKDFLRFMFATGEFGVSFVLPPNVPLDRLAALQNAFESLPSDPKFSADAAKQGRDITFHDPKKLMTLVMQLRAISPETLKELEKILPSAFN